MNDDFPSDVLPPTAVGGAVQSTTALTHNTGNAATGGIWRVRGPAGTAILKIARPPSEAPLGVPGWQTSAEPTHWNYWKREPLAYKSGFAASVYVGSGITAPGLLHVEDRSDGSIALWLADVAGERGDRWPVGQLAAFARSLGQAQGAWVGRALPKPWLSRDWLRQYLADRQVPRDVPWDEPAGAVWPQYVRRGVRRIWENRTNYLAVADAAPHTLCHLDVWPMNLVADDGRSVLLDWAFVGDGAVGEDVANLVVDSVADGHIDAALLPEIRDAVTAAYIAGLGEAGCSIGTDIVRNAIAATGVAKYSWLAPAMLGRVARGTPPGDVNYGVRASTEELFARRRGLLAQLVDWADELGTS